MEFRGGATRGIRTTSSCQLDSSIDQVRPNDSTARCFQDLNRELTQKAKSNYGNSIPQLHIRGADSVERNCSHRGERGIFGANCGIRNSSYQQAWHAGKFSVYGMANARTSDAISDVDIRNSLTDCDYFSSTAIAERTGRIEPGAHGCHSGNHAIATKFAQNFTHEIRTGLCFLEQVFPRKISRSTLRACGNQRASNTHEHATSLHLRRWNIDDLDFAGTGVLQNLFHASAATYNSPEEIQTIDFCRTRDF